MQYLTIKQVCELTGLKYSTVISWTNQGIWPAYKIKNGKKSKYFFVQSEIEARIKRGRIGN